MPELSLGNPDGVPIVEYGSLTCPHCAAFSREVMPKLKAQYIDSGKVHFIFREFSRNPLDVAAFVLARCVGEDKALATIDLLFAVQDKWAFVDSPLEPLLAAVRPTGLSREKAMACLKDQSKADAMQKIVKTAEDVVKVQGTPTFVIDGKVYGGELSMAGLRRDIEAAGEVRAHLHHRRNRRPASAPAATAISVPSGYQLATNSGKSSVQLVA